MPLSCELGWHSADPLARWNCGYYFTKCTRCGCDLVRTAYTGWKVPKGFKVVWQAEPPAGWQTAALVPAGRDTAGGTDAAGREDEAARTEGTEAEFKEPAPDDTEPELPIMALLRDLDPAPPEDAQVGVHPGEDEAAGDPAAAPEQEAAEAETVATNLPEPAPDLREPEPEPEPEPAPIRQRQSRSVFDDFMEEDTGLDPPWVAPPAPAAPEPADDISASGLAPAPALEVGPESPVDDTPCFRPLPPLDEDGQADTREARRTGPKQGWWLAAAGVAAAATLLALPSYGDGAREPDAPENPKVAVASEPVRSVPKAPPAPPPQAQAKPQPSRQVAFVAGGIVNCRAAPAREAPSVKKLSRGAKLEILARESDWLSVSHKDRQCWLAARYVSPAKPL